MFHGNGNVSWDTEGKWKCSMEMEMFHGTWKYPMSNYDRDEQGRNFLWDNPALQLLQQNSYSKGISQKFPKNCSPHPVCLW